MTNIEFLNKSTAEELAERIVKDEKFRCAFDTGVYDSFFKCDAKCKCCRYYEDGNTWEDSWMNGMCCLDEGDECPYNINRDDVLKNEILKWLNSDM